MNIFPSRVFLIALLLFCSVFSTYAQEYDTLIQRAYKLYFSKDYDQGVIAFDQAFKIKKNRMYDLYNAGCNAALASQPQKALEFLNLSFENGWQDINHLKNDPDLISLHHLKAWSSLVKKIQKKVDEIEKNYDKPLQAELINIYKEDQQYRKMMDSVSKQFGYKSIEMEDLLKKMNLQDSLNLVRIKAILDTKGWLGKDKIGPQANATLFLVIQHSDLPTQQKYLPMMRQAVKKGNALASDLALLEDRVALGEGKKQLYGSQIGMDKDGKHFVLPLEDPDNVDKRRAEVGLSPMNQYLQYFNLTWNPDEYKKQPGGSGGN